MSTISIALCTYNGSRYLPAQLDSILQQSRLPDELVVCDDGSEDDTLQILAEFAERAPFPVRVHRQPVNLGSTKNFEDAIQRCSGDYIALCDQDDTWKPQRLQHQAEALDQLPDCAYAFSDAELIDGTGRPLNRRLWRAVGFRPKMPLAPLAMDLFPLLLRQNVVTGATMMFRAALRSRVTPISTSWVHDGWIAMILSASSPCVVDPTPLIEYRQHAGQQIGAPLRGASIVLNRQMLVVALERCRSEVTTRGDQLLELAAKLSVSDPSNAGLIGARANECQARREHVEARIAAIKGVRRAQNVWNELRLGRYQMYSLGYLSACRDLLGIV